MLNAMDTLVGVGQPWEKKRPQIGVRVTPTLRDRIEKAAARDHRKPSTWIQVWLGHKHLATTERYLHPDPRQVDQESRRRFVDGPNGKRMAVSS